MWFIVVTFLNATIPNSNMNEIFIFSNPSFEQQVDCNNYVQVMNMDIYAKAKVHIVLNIHQKRYIVLKKNKLEK